MARSVATREIGLRRRRCCLIVYLSLLFLTFEGRLNIWITRFARHRITTRNAIFLLLLLLLLYFGTGGTKAFHRSYVPFRQR